MCSKYNLKPIYSCILTPKVFLQGCLLIFIHMVEGTKEFWETMSSEA